MTTPRALVLVAVALTLQYTRLGKATRAVSDNVDLASATGMRRTSNGIATFNNLIVTQAGTYQLQGAGGEPLSVDTVWAS